MEQRRTWERRLAKRVGRSTHAVGAARRGGRAASRCGLRHLLRYHPRRPTPPRHDDHVDHVVQDTVTPPSLRVPWRRTRKRPWSRSDRSGTAASSVTLTLLRYAPPCAIVRRASDLLDTRPVRASRSTTGGSEPATSADGTDARALSSVRASSSPSSPWPNRARG